MKNLLTAICLLLMSSATFAESTRYFTATPEIQIVDIHSIGLCATKDYALPVTAKCGADGNTRSDVCQYVHFWTTSSERRPHDNSVIHFQLVLEKLGKHGLSKMPFKLDYQCLEWKPHYTY